MDHQLRLLTLIVLSLANFVATSETRIRNVVIQKSTLDPNSLQRLYTDHVLWNSYVTTIRECSVLCANDERCFSFTLAISETLGSSASRRVCRGHSSQASALIQQSGFVVVPEAVLFDISSRSPIPVIENNVNWLYKTCTSEANCTVLQPNTSCISNVCVCTLGLYYSVSSKSCLYDCPASGLQSTYTRYSHWGILSPFDDKPSPSVSNCLSLCTNNTNILCRSLNFGPDVNDPSKTRCYMTGIVSPGSDFYNVPFSEYYQRQCS